jgi:hypothetical protein
MQSNHIENRKLYIVAREEGVLNREELLHLSKCDECMEIIRAFVRQSLSNASS